MAAISSKNTKPEMTVRKLVYSMGYRYRLHRKELPGKPDLVFSSRRKVIFVHGCFWHQHGCKDSHVPRTNVSYWVPKLEKNVARDKKHIDALATAGWKVLVLWDCELADTTCLKARLLDFL